MSVPLSSSARIAFLGPRGSFSEQALLSDDDLARCERIESPTITEAIRAAATGGVDFAFVPIENSIEGSVSSTIDELIFGSDLFIQREVIIDIHIDLLATSGAALEGITEVISHPHALAQVRRYLAVHLPDAVTNTTNSTSDAARLVADSGRADLAALAPPAAASTYGLAVLASAIEDQHDNETRFVLVAPGVVQPRSGRDRTSIVCFQRADRPGSLQSILGAFSDRGVNLTRIESRPTKLALGDYCFVIEIEGHVADAAVLDALRELYDGLSDLRFLGSYPVSRHTIAETAREDAAARPTVEAWIGDLLRRLPTAGPSGDGGAAV